MQPHRYRTINRSLTSTLRQQRREQANQTGELVLAQHGKVSEMQHRRSCPTVHAVLIPIHTPVVASEIHDPMSLQWIGRQLHLRS